MLRLSLLMFLTCCLINFGTAQKKSLPIQVISATSQTWVSGAPGGRTGTNYIIQVYIASDQKTEFKSLWLGKENLPVNIEFPSPSVQTKIEKGDTIILTCNRVNGEPIENFHPKKVPVKYQGDALVETLVNQRKRYFIVKKFKTLSSLRGQ